MQSCFLPQEAELFPLATGGSAQAAQRNHQAALSICKLGSDLREEETGLLVDVGNFDAVGHLTLMPSAWWPLERLAA